MEVDNNLVELVKPFVSTCAYEKESGSCELTDCQTCNAITLANKIIEDGYPMKGESVWVYDEQTKCYKRTSGKIQPDIMEYSSNR